MPTYDAQERWLRILQPADPLLLAVSLQGTEAVSELFRFDVEFVTEVGVKLDFEKVLNQPMTIEIAHPSSPTRYLNGVVSQLSQLRRDSDFVYYRALLVPALWRLTQSAHNRIFQQKTVVEILRIVLDGITVKYQVSSPPRPHNYCVQYRETDYAFACRLMEEHGLFYYFTHDSTSHEMIIGDVSRNNPLLPADATIEFDDQAGGRRTKSCIRQWIKTQELRPGRVSCRDYHFQLPDQVLESSQASVATVQVGAVKHQLLIGNDHWTMDEPRGEYAHMFDGVGPTGDQQSANLQQAFAQKDETARLRMEELSCAAVRVEGASDCSHLTAGYCFTLARHFDGDGKYLLTRVEHEAAAGDYRSGRLTPESSYQNRFVCTPQEVPFRPERRTPRPKTHGPLLAAVVGPPGEEIFTDPFGRIKIQFPWDREGKHDAHSSCWVRPFSPMAGNAYGMVQVPRVGHEVLVEFLEGDPDEPVVVGSAFNPNQMPPFKLPDHRTRLAWKSQTKNGDANQFSGLAVEDAPGQEQVHLHSERDLRFNAENNHLSSVGGSRYETVKKTHRRQVGGPPSIGGGEDDSESEDENDYEGPFRWKSGEISSSVGADVEMVFGAHVEATTGINAEVVIGENIEVIINPLGYLTGAGLLAGLLGGEYTLNFGSETQAVYGDQFEAHHGGKTEICGYANDESKALLQKAGAGFAAAVTASVLVGGGLGPKYGSTTSMVELACGLVGLYALGVMAEAEKANAEAQEALEDAEFAERLEKQAAIWTPVVTDVVKDLSEAAVKAAEKSAQEAEQAAKDAAAALSGATGAADRAAGVLDTLAQANREIIVSGGVTMRAQDQIRITSKQQGNINPAVASNIFLEAQGLPAMVDGLVSLTGSSSVSIQGSKTAALSVGNGMEDSIVMSVSDPGTITLKMASQFPQIKITQLGITLSANPDCYLMLTENGIEMMAPSVLVEGETDVTLSSDETEMVLSPEGMVMEGLTLEQTIEVSIEIETLTSEAEATEVSYVYAMLEVE